MRVVTRASSWLAVATLSACLGLSSPSVEVQTLDVAAQKVACVGEGQRECLRVRRVPDGEWENFFGTIEGFTHEPGWRTRIEVERRRVPNPPADASSWSYRLLRVLSSEREP